MAPIEDERDDPLKRHQRKAENKAGGDDDDLDAALAQAATETKEMPKPERVDEDDLDAALADTAAKAAAELVRAKPIDYSRFKNIGEDDKEERAKTGDLLWSDLSKDERGKVYEAQEQYEQILDKKREEEDEWKRQLRDKPSDLSWVEGKHFANYESFCVGRVEATFKKAGNQAFKEKKFDEAKQQWEAGINMLLALGTLPPEATTTVCMLRNNLAQLAMKNGDWDKVKELTDKVIDREPTNEKALYRRAYACDKKSLYDKADRDLAILLKNYPENKAGEALQGIVHRKLGKDRKRLGGKAISDIACGLEELAPDGTIRKLRIEEYGEGDPDARPNWIKEEWTQGGDWKAVVTCQMIIWSVGGDELFNSKEYRPFPDSKQGRDELKEYMDMVNFLDQEAGKKPRLVGDFYQKVKKRPVRWYVGDPGMYKGFDLAVRTMKPQERSLYEVDQPQLNPSVTEYYEKLGFHSGVAGLPQLVYHIEEERLAILEDEVPEKELDLDTKTQRGVRVELQLMGYIVCKDTSPKRDGAKLHGVLHPGMPDQPLVKAGDIVRGSFFINRPFDGSLLVQNGYVEWRLGQDEGLFEKLGDEKEPLRPDGGPFVPKCIGQAILDVDWCPLHYGCLLEVRLRVGPELHEIAPQYKKQFEQARRENHKKGRKGGASVSILVQVFPVDYDSSEAQKTAYADEDELKELDMDIE